MGFTYLAALLAFLGCMALLDRRWKLFFWDRPGRAALTLAIGLAFFLAWDLFGIGLDIFYRGETPFMLGIEVAPELPLEELFFLTFLCYLTVVLHGLCGVALAALRSRRDDGNRTTAAGADADADAAGRPAP